MIYPSADKLEKWGSKYSLVVLAAKRAKQLKSGAPPMIETTSRNALTIALEEIAAGKIYCQVADHDILPKTSRETEIAQLLAIPTLSVDDEGTAEVIAEFSDETELIAEDEDEDIEEVSEEEDVEHESGFVEDDEEEEEEPPFLGEEAAEAEVAEGNVIPATEEPAKPKRGRKKKVEAEVAPLDEPEEIEVEDTEDSDD